MVHTSAARSARRTCKENRIDRRLAEHQTGKRRVVIALRQRKGRTLTFVASMKPTALLLRSKSLRRLPIIHADEATHWDALPFGLRNAAHQSQRCLQLTKAFDQSG